MKGRTPRLGRPSKQEQGEAEGEHGKVFKAIVHPDRRRILLLLSERPRPVHDLSDHFDVSRPMISKHLRTLREAGLVESEMAGREQIYRPAEGKTVRLALQIAQADVHYDDIFQQVQKRLEPLPDDS